MRHKRGRKDTVVLLVEIGASIGGEMANFFVVVQLFSQSDVTLFNPMDCSMPGLPVHHHLLELTQTHVRRVDDASQPSPPLSSPSPAISLSQPQGLFQSVGFSHQEAKVLELQLQHQSFQ